MTLRVVRGGLLTTVQDIGRPGHQHNGVPEGGAMDALALRVANLLVGNDEGDAGLEITVAGPELVLERTTLLALAGADLGGRIDGHPVPGGRTVLAAAGTVLTFDPIGRPPSLEGEPGTRTPGLAPGARAYLAVAGGIAVVPVLGSRSTYLRARLGGLDGRALRAGDRLPVGPASPLAERMARALLMSVETRSNDESRSDAHHAAGSPSSTRGPSDAPRSVGGRAPHATVARWSVDPALRPPPQSDVVVRLIAGAHARHLSPASRERLYDASFRVQPESDRMGYRLAGPALELERPLEVLSEAVAFGTVQLPPGGAPIVLMADRQTTGGYPRLGEVATVDRPILAQLRPGDQLRFQPIAVDEAQALYLARERCLDQARRAIALRFDE